MTTEKAIELLHRISDSQFDGIHGDERREALSMAVRALFSQQIVNDSQGLVNDCISRKMAIDEVKRLHDVAWANWKETRISANTMIDALKDLPSAQPQRKKGKWLVDEDGNMECPFCGNTCGFGNYCNECGADMRGESDE